MTLEDLEGLGFAIPIGDPADQAEKFVGIINDRCGGIHGRKLDLSLVEAPPLAPEGQDPNAVAQAACIEATEDNKAVFAFSGSGWGGQGGAACVTDAHDTIYLTTYNVTQEDLAGADNRLYSIGAVVGRRPRVPRPHARRARRARRQDDRHRDAGLARRSRHRRSRA